MAKITVQQTEVTIVTFNEQKSVSLTDLANAKESVSRAADTIKNWLRNRYSLEFRSTREMIHNPNFKVSNLTTLNHKWEYHLLLVCNDMK
jgi:phage gp36-like protein